MSTVTRNALTIKPVGLLNGIDHIGQIFRFRVADVDTGVVAVITAELRQISHNGRETTINFGIGCANKDEATLDHDHPISLLPPDNYSDVATLAQYRPNRQES